MDSAQIYPKTQLNDQSITNSTTLTDSELTLFIPANRNYHFDLFVPFALGGITSGYKFRLELPSGISFLLEETELINGVSLTLVVTRVDASVTTINGALATAGDHLLKVRGTVYNGSTPGNVKLQFAQNVADAVNAITLKKGAHLWLVEVKT